MNVAQDPFSLEIRELVRERERFELIVQGSSACIYDWNIESNEAYMSENYWEMLGYGPGHGPANYDRWVEQLHPDERDQVLKDLQLQLSNNDKYELEYRLRTKTNEYRWVRACGKVKRNESGTAIRMAGSLTDITLQRKMDEALRSAHSQLERRVEERTAELAKVNEALRVEAKERKKSEASRNRLLQKLATIEEDQRRHMARELHDELSQLVVGLKLGLQGLDHNPIRDGFSTDRVQGLSDTTDQLGVAIRTLASRLRPSGLDDQGLLAALENYLEDWSEKSNIVADIEYSGVDQRRLSKAVSTALFRIVQEGLTNVVKHSKATSVDIILKQQPNSLSLILEDNGIGISDLTRVGERVFGWGLLGIRERAELLGGSFEIESQPGCGTTLFVKIPSSTES